ncbi:hypothetical protein OG579_16980 [Williamsia herbipolensis]|uniref:DUF222 domain-containing protein n=1 Tax=Williamsia herbipolensis TaxID=1603258 RepID=A0AAU4K019_9NOCA|nr:hypothetical protein [Williamsia herbipolensis]
MPEGVAALLSASDVATLNTTVGRDDATISEWMRDCAAMQATQRPTEVVVPADVVGAYTRCTVAAQKLVRHLSALAVVDVDDRNVAKATLHAWRCEIPVCPAQRLWDERLARLLRFSTLEQRMQLAAVYPIHARLAEMMTTAAGLETVRAMAGEQW